jgi:hypothetical protein
MRKRGFQLGWNYLIPLILAVVILVVLMIPTIAWAKSSWKSFSEKAGTLWGLKPPKPVTPGTQFKFDALNLALRDQSKFKGNVISYDQLKLLLSNFESQQLLTLQGARKAYLLKSTVDGKGPIYLLYIPETGSFSVVSEDFDLTDSVQYTLDEAISKNIRLNVQASLQLKESWIPFDYYRLDLLDKPETCFPKYNLCLPRQLREALEAAIKFTPTK